MKDQLQSLQYIIGLFSCFLVGVLISPYLGSTWYPEVQQYPRARFTESIAQDSASRVKELLGNSVISDRRPISATFSDGEELSRNDGIAEKRLNGTVSDQLEGRSFIDLDVKTPDLDELYERLVIVTAFSQNHYKEAMGTLGTAQSQMPGKKIVVYDLGLEDEARKRVLSFCNVELRPFPFERYPEHVKKLHVYAWKPLIINITLNEFGTIFWGDAAVRFGGSLKELLPLAEQHHGYLAYIHSFDPKKEAPIKHQYFYTHEGMFEYMGINRTVYYQEEDSSPHATANRQLFINSTTIQAKIVQPLVECALDIDCISPKGSRLGEHRYDASALALYIYKNMKYEFTPKRNSNEEFSRITRMEREDGGKYHPHGC